MKATYQLGLPIVAAGEKNTVDVQISFEAGDDKSPRRPLNLSLVLDRSGSMWGQPLTQAIKAANLMVDRLTEEDFLSIVVYDDHIRTVLSPQLVKDKAAVKNLLNKIRAGGITNLSGGWLEGCKHVKSGSRPETINRVMLLTDGQANMGITDRGQLSKLAREKAGEGVVTTTLGFGAYFNEDLLIDMAEASGGNFYFIQSPGDAAEVFRIEVEGLASIVAEDMVATIKPAPGVSLAEVLNIYPVQTTDDGSTIQLGEVYSIEPKRLNLKLEVSAPSGDVMHLADLAYSYDAQIGEGIDLHQGSLTLEVKVGSLEEIAAAEPDMAVIKQATSLIIGKAKEEAVTLADTGQHAKAASRLRQLIDDFKAKGLDESYEIAEELDHLDYYARLLERGQWNVTYRKEMKDQSYQARKRGRDDLQLRGTTSGSTAELETVTLTEGEEASGVVVTCSRDGGKLHIHVVSEGYDSSLKVQFPRSIRQEGARYLVEELVLSKNGSFYRAKGTVKLLLRPGESRPGTGAPKKKGTLQKANAKTWADVPTTNDVGDGVLIQIVKEKKLRARVVSDGFDPNKNMRFPRSIRKEGVMFVVDDVKPSSDGSYYIAYGKILRLAQDDEDDSK